MIKDQAYFKEKIKMAQNVVVEAPTSRQRTFALKNQGSSTDSIDQTSSKDQREDSIEKLMRKSRQIQKNLKSISRPVESHRA